MTHPAAADSLFVTSDLYLSSAISLLCGVNPTYRRRESGIVDFAFPKSEGVLAAAEAYAKNRLDVKAFAFSNRVKYLRGEMFVFRSSQDAEGFANRPRVPKEADHE